MKYWFETFFKLVDALGICVLLQHSYWYLLHYIMLYMHINKFTTDFSGGKVPRTLVVLKMAIQFRKKEME